MNREGGPLVHVPRFEAAMRDYPAVESILSSPAPGAKKIQMLAGNMNPRSRWMMVIGFLHHDYRI
jgi:hypothetical protein